MRIESPENFYEFFYEKNIFLQKRKRKALQVNITFTNRINYSRMLAC